MFHPGFVFLFLGLCLAAPGAWGAENSCVQCHQGLPADTFIGAKFASWKDSLHDREGITCDRCHAGNPSAGQKDAAHAGVFNSASLQSRVYYKNVPGTCGACHRRDFNIFRQSLHYALLEKTGAGPTCVTCHDSHATRVLSPRQLPGTCEQCHNPRRGISPQVPSHAQALLLLINETSLLEKCVAPQVRDKSDDWRRSRASLKNLRDEWHAFNLNQVQASILAAYETIARLLGRQK